MAQMYVTHPWTRVVLFTVVFVYLATTPASADERLKKCPPFELLFFFSALISGCFFCTALDSQFTI